MLIDVDLDPWCKNCNALEIDENRFFSEDSIYMTVRTCAHRSICRNAIRQYEKKESERIL